MKMRMLEEKDIPVCLGWYNWYILNSRATFETEPLSLEAFTERVHGIRKRYPWIIAEEDGKPCGYAYLGTFNSRPAYDWTADVSIYLDPQERGHGIGHALMNELERIAILDGYRNLVSIVTSGNEASEHLHKACGYEAKALFEDFGYKTGKWLGVTYFVKKLPFEEKGEPEEPCNRNPYQ